MLQVCPRELTLSIPPCGSGMSGPDAADALAYRAIPGWGVRQATGAVGEINLLLVADRLLGAPPPAGDVGSGDRPALWQALLEAGRVLLAPPETGASGSDAAMPPPQDVDRWLTALRAGGEAWERQEAVAEALHRAGPRQDLPWRDVLRQAGLSAARHQFRNRLQTLDVLATLGSWGVEEGLDEELAAEVLGPAYGHLRRSLRAAAPAGAVAHDWEDMAPLYACSGFAPRPRLEVCLPVLTDAEPEAVAELLISDALDPARRALCRSLSEPSGPSVAEVVAEAVDRAVPARLRVPGVAITLAFHGPLSDLRQIGVAAVAISSWRLRD